MSDVSLTCHVSVFATKEFDFFKNWKVYKRESMLAGAGLVRSEQEEMATGPGFVTLSLLLILGYVAISACPDW